MKETFEFVRIVRPKQFPRNVTAVRLLLFAPDCVCVAATYFMSGYKMGRHKPQKRPPPQNRFAINHKAFGRTALHFVLLSRWHLCAAIYDAIRSVVRLNVIRPQMNEIVYAQCLNVCCDRDYDNIIWCRARTHSIKPADVCVAWRLGLVHAIFR